MTSTYPPHPFWPRTSTIPWPRTSCTRSSYDSTRSVFAKDLRGPRSLAKDLGTPLRPESLAKHLGTPRGPWPNENLTSNYPPSPPWPRISEGQGPWPRTSGHHGPWPRTLEVLDQGPLAQGPRSIPRSPWPRTSGRQSRLLAKDRKPLLRLDSLAKDLGAPRVSGHVALAKDLGGSLAKALGTSRGHRPPDQNEIWLQITPRSALAKDLRGPRSLLGQGPRPPEVFCRTHQNNTLNKPLTNP